MEKEKGLDRRDFLKGLSAAAVAAGAVGSSASASDKKFWDRFRHHCPSREVDFGLPVTRDKENVEFIGWNDLQGRSTLQVTAKGDWLFVGHHHNTMTNQGPLLNPLTGQYEWNGTTILDIHDPCHPKLVAHIPNPEDTNCRSAQVVYNFGPKKRDYLVRNHDPTASPNKSAQVFDITNRSKPVMVSEITTGPRGGLIGFLHKGWWSQDSGLYYCAAREIGIGRGAYLMIFDLNNPEKPVPVSDFWLPGQEKADDRRTWHHPIVDEEYKRVYGAYLEGGDTIAVDITDIHNPKLLWRIDFSPPYRGTHTVCPIFYDEVPNFTPGASSLPRWYALVSDEGTDNQCSGPIRAKSYMMDITDAETTGVPLNIGTWQVPDDDFCKKGARFGPHQFAETVDTHINRFEDKIAYFAYFNAGLRVVDISNPYALREVGHFTPLYNKLAVPIATGQPLAIQSNDVDIDYRGLIYMPDRTGSGLFVLKYTGEDEKHGDHDEKHGDHDR
jgi:hypothetical protein